MGASLVRDLGTEGSLGRLFFTRAIYKSRDCMFTNQQVIVLYHYSSTFNMEIIRCREAFCFDSPGVSNRSLLIIVCVLYVSHCGNFYSRRQQQAARGITSSGRKSGRPSSRCRLTYRVTRYLYLVEGFH